jgi:hypothetical protein
MKIAGLVLVVAAVGMRAQQSPAPIERPKSAQGQIATIHVESRLVSVALNVVC